MENDRTFSGAATTTSLPEEGFFDSVKLLFDRSPIESLLEEIRNLEKKVSSLTRPRSDFGQHVLAFEGEHEFHAWVKVAYSDRQARKAFFKDPHILGEPCWDIMLDLTAAELEHKKISITSACIASGVPPTTALRWIAILEKDGIVERSHDENDRRRMFVRMTEFGMRQMHNYYLKIRH